MVKNKTFQYILFALLAISLVFYSVRNNLQTKQASSPATKIDQKVKKTSTEVEVSSTKPNPRREVVLKAESSLEKPEALLSGEAKTITAESITNAMNYFQTITDFATLEANSENGLSLTSVSMLQTTGALILTGYHYDQDSLQVYESDAENVYQFIFTLSKTEEDVLSFSGNYVPGTRQIEIVNMYGKPSQTELDVEPEKAIYN